MRVIRCCRSAEHLSGFGSGGEFFRSGHVVADRKSLASECSRDPSLRQTFVQGDRIRNLSLRVGPSALRQDDRLLMTNLWKQNVKGPRSDARAFCIRNLRRLVDRAKMPEVADLGRRSNLLQQANHKVASIGLAPGPSQAREARPRVVITMPVLTLHQMDER